MAAFAVARRFPGVLRSFYSLIPSTYNGSSIVRPIYQLSSHNITQRQVFTDSIRKPLLAVSSISSGVSFPITSRVTHLLQNIPNQQVRTLISCSLRKGKRKTVRAVTQRFLRLHCGLWLRRRAGYKKKMWKKKSNRKKRLREHVFCNKRQSKLLDKMTSSFWKRRNWYVDDPYQKYHDRTNFQL